MAKYKPATILVIVFIFASLLQTHVSAQTIYFQDDFNDGNADGWAVPRNTCFYNGSAAVWTVENNRFGIRINGGGCVTETIPLAISIPPNTSYSFDVDMTMAQVANMDRNFVFKYQDSQNWYGIHTVGNNLYLHKVVNGIEYFLPNWHIIFGFQDGLTYHFRVEVRPNEYKVFIDGSLVTTVPDDLLTFPNSKAGLQASAGGIPSSEVWFDNVLVQELPSSTPTPTVAPTLTPTPTATPTLTPIANIGNFELPFIYPGRLADNPTQFRSAFWDKMRAVFDHTLQTGVFKPFTGATYYVCFDPISCYDSHNGTDFSGAGNQQVYSVSTGTVVYSSPHDSSSCTSTGGGFGCVVIVKYGGIYALFAHLDKIFINDRQYVSQSTLIGEMGATGCEGCLEHLHFGVLKPIKNLVSLLLLGRMTRNDWQGLLFNVRPSSFPTYPPACTYHAPNGVQFSFQDPSGWAGEDKDPWSIPRKKGGCGINSHYLWKYDIGTSP